jgi:hypothetical protein
MGEDAIIPVKVGLRMWGSNYGDADTRWVVKFQDGQTQVLKTGTSAGARLTLYVTCRVIETSKR